MAEPNERTATLLGEGIILLAITAVSYLVVFHYERAYATHFGIPFFLIQVDLKGLLIIASTLFTILLVIFHVFNLLAMMLPSKLPTPLQHSISKILPIVVPTLIIAYLYGTEYWQKWILYVELLLGLIAFEFLFPIVSQHHVKGYINKLTAAQAHDDSTTDLVTIIRNRSGRNSILLVFYVLFALLIASTTGDAEALKQEEFLVVDTEPPRVVLRKYGQNLVCALLDETNKRVYPVFTFLTVGEPSHIFSLRKVGPLTLVKDRNPDQQDGLHNRRQADSLSNPTIELSNGNTLP